MLLELIHAHLKLLVLMRKRATLAFVIVAFKVMGLNAVTSMNVLTEIHARKMQLARIQKAVILAVVTTDMKAMGWFVENKRDVKT